MAGKDASQYSYQFAAYESKAEDGRMSGVTNVLVLAANHALAEKAAWKALGPLKAEKKGLWLQSVAEVEALKANKGA